MEELSAWYNFATDRYDYRPGAPTEVEVWQYIPQEPSAQQL